jgi:hypothetical protein
MHEKLIQQRKTEFIKVVKIILKWFQLTFLSLFNPCETNKAIPQSFWWTNKNVFVLFSQYKHYFWYIHEYPHKLKINLNFKYNLVFYQ